MPRTIKCEEQQRKRNERYYDYKTKVAFNHAKCTTFFYTTQPFHSPTTIASHSASSDITLSKPLNFLIILHSNCVHWSWMLLTMGKPLTELTRTPISKHSFFLLSVFLSHFTSLHDIKTANYNVQSICQPISLSKFLALLFRKFHD